MSPQSPFIDELDALGKKRSMRISSSNEDPRGGAADPSSRRGFIPDNKKCT